MTKSRRIDGFRSLPVVATLSLASLVGCGLLTKKGGDKADAEVVAETVDAAPPAAPEAIASNVDSVSRFGDEKSLENVAAPLQRSTNVREIPSVGKIVATLAKGANVSKIAQRGTAFLVLFDNPKEPKKLMGWVGQESFTPGAATTTDPGIKTIACTAPEVPLISDAPFCGRVCTSDSDCPAGQACRGFANKLVKAKVGESINLCTVFTPAKRPAAPVATGAGRAGTPVAPPPPPPPAAPASVSSQVRRQPNGARCSELLNCASFVCTGGFCKACVRDSDCPKLDKPTMCSSGQCVLRESADDDERPSSPASSPDRGRDKPAPKGKGLGASCNSGSDCAPPRICKRLFPKGPSTRSTCQ